MITEGHIDKTAPVRVDRAAQILDVAPSTVLYWIKIGKLPAYKIGRAWRIDVEDVAKMVGDMN